MDERATNGLRTLRVFALTTEQSAEAILKKILDPLRSEFTDIYVEGVVSGEFPKSEIKPFLSSDSLKIMGLIDVILSLPRILSIQNKIKKRILEGDFDIVLTIDSSSFHLPLVESLKKAGCTAKFVHAVCPPIWAYRPKRKPRIARTFDLLLPLFKFETPLFNDTPLASFWIGHPFQEYAPVKKGEEENILLIFPGSREKVIKRNLPLQLAAARRFPYKILISVSSLSSKKLIEKMAPSIPTFEKIPPVEILKHTKIALATSGTITLELALLGIQTVVTYKIPLIDAIAAKLAKMNVPFFALPNLLANKEIYIELIHPFLTEKKLVDAIRTTLDQKKPIPVDLLVAQIKTEHTGKELVNKIIENTPFMRHSTGS
jgi:lipid-A-disaccharide synthase